MFYIKNDDMEDMFKKAADEYELNEEMAADWNKVQAALQDDGEVAPLIKKEKKRRLYFLWLLLLVPATMIFTYKTNFLSHDKNVNRKPGTAKEKSIERKEASPGKNDMVTGNNTSSLVQKTTTGNSIQRINNSNKKIAADHKFISGNNESLPAITNKTINNIHTTLSNNSKIPSTENNLLQADVANNNKNYNDLSDNSSSNATANSNELTSLNNTNTTAASQSKTEKQKKKNNNYTRQAYAYTGFIANADLSFVKFQKTSSPGFGIGIIGGYHLKNGLSFETGVLYDKKNYYTKGEYFDKSKLAYLQYVNLLTANGNCNMWEIPLTVKYDFNTKKNHNWFVTTGFSSYIMHKEYYNYKYEKDGVVSEKGYDYYHSSQNWFSVLNVGGGINIKTSNKYFLQVQPYYKIPVSGVGQGSLSLSSAGINLSITRRLH